MRLIIKKKPTVAPVDGGLCIPGPRGEPGVEQDVKNTYKLLGNVGTIMTVDPGLGGTGYAIWERTDFDKCVPPVESGSLAPSDFPYCKDKPWWVAAFAIATTLRNRCQRFAVAAVYLEQPAFMEGGKGLAAARDGDLVKLTSLYGIIAGHCCDSGSRLFVPVPISEWKGNMPKDVCHPRIFKKLPGWKPGTSTTHEVDAVGIGLYVKGFFS